MNAFSFKKNDRILKRADFTRLWKSGKKVYGKYFIIHYSKNSLGKTRLGVTVSKKVGCAVVRNRIKRLVRESFRKNNIRFEGSADMNVIARTGAGALENHDLLQTLERNFLKISKDSQER